MKSILRGITDMMQTAYGRLGTAMVLAFSAQPVTRVLGAELDGTRNFLDRLQNPETVGTGSPNNIPVNPFSGIYDQIANANNQGGYEGMKILFDMVLQAAVTLLTGIAVIFIVAAGIRMILESNNEETAKKQTVTIFNIIAGTIIMNIANFGISRVAPDTSVTNIDNILGKFDSLEGIKATATGFATVVVFPLLDFALSFLAGLALLYIVYCSLNIITHRGDEEKIKDARARVVKTFMGIAVILLNKFLIGMFYGNFDNDLTPDLQYGIDAAFNVANYILSFLGLVAVVMIIYAGIMIVTSGGEEKRRSQGIKIIQYVMYGVIMAMSAYTLMSGIIGITTRAP